MRSYIFLAMTLALGHVNSAAIPEAGDASIQRREATEADIDGWLNNDPDAIGTNVPRNLQEREATEADIDGWLRNDPDAVGINVPRDISLQERGTNQADIEKWVKEHPNSGTDAANIKAYIDKHPITRRDLGAVGQGSSLMEKRVWATCTTCHAACILLYAREFRTHWESLMRCTGICSASGACTAAENLRWVRGET